MCKDNIITQYSTYAGVEFLSITDGSNLISECIRSGEPFLAARVGETEMGTIRAYGNPIKNWRDVRLYSNMICESAGFFPKNVIKIRQFCKLYKESLWNIDYYGAFDWSDEEKYLLLSKDLKKCFPARVLDVLDDDVRWSGALKDKKVLIVNPFTETIKKQYKEKRKSLFQHNKEILPSFELITYKSVQSIGGKGAAGYKSWFDALEYMKNDINNIDFDIALLGCGAYGVPLASHIKNTGKQAIYMGGCLQLMFGIIGKRWENEDYVKRYINDEWVRPMESEKPYNFNMVEDGCYW